MQGAVTLKALSRIRASLKLSKRILSFLLADQPPRKSTTLLLLVTKSFSEGGLAMASNFWLAGSPYENGTSALAARLIAVLRRRKANEMTEDLREMTLIHETGSHTRLEDRHV